MRTRPARLGGLPARLIGLVVLLGLSLALAARADAYVYWSSYWETVGRANLNGGGVRENLIRRAGDARGLAIDRQYLYWAIEETGNIARARLDGTEVDREFIRTGYPTDLSGVAVDSGHVYFTFRFRSLIGRANLDGTNVDPDFMGLDDNVYSPESISVDAGHIYWVDQCWCGLRIGRANLDGSGSNPNFITGLAETPQGLAVDARRIYWTTSDGTSSTTTDGRIGRANLDGSGADPNFITGAGEPMAVAVDAKHIYWSGPGLSNEGWIGRADLDGSGADPNFIETLYIAFPLGVAVNADRQPPNTQIEERPQNKGKKRTVKYEFTSDAPYARFQCRLKGKGLSRSLKRFRSCDSPRTYKRLKRGRYRFQVRAIDESRRRDATPATDTFTVV
jgi:hypothetical protein